jgi:hypothetical protein
MTPIMTASTSALVVCFAALTASAAPVADPSKGSTEQDVKVKAELKELRETLQKAIELRMNQWQGGAVTLDVVRDDVRTLARVNLEFSSDKDERVKALGECIKLAEQIQKAAEVKVTAGLATEADALEAKALVQELRVHLLREGTKREK